MRKSLLLGVLVLCCAFPVLAQADCLLTYQTEAVPLFYVGQQANFQFEAVSGTPPYNFQVNPVGDPLPAGLSLKKDGRVKGKPTEETPNSVVYITLSDAAGCMLTQAFNFEVWP
jgi:hypothetical protein